MQWFQLKERLFIQMTVLSSWDILIPDIHGRKSRISIVSELVELFMLKHHYRINDSWPLCMTPTMKHSALHTQVGYQSQIIGFVGHGILYISLWCTRIYTLGFLNHRMFQNMTQSTLQLTVGTNYDTLGFVGHTILYMIHSVIHSTLVGTLYCVWWSI